MNSEELADRESLSWIYESTGYLDIRRLDGLGSARPTWTHNFLTWQAFKTYVAGVVSGTRKDYPSWYAAEDWDRAINELRRGQ